MPRGGKRPGAGRKYAVTLATAHEIRKDCEQRAQIHQEQQARQRTRRKLEKRGIRFGEDGDPNPLDAVPVAYRKAVTEYGRNPRKRISHFPAEVQYAIETMREARKAAKAAEGKPMGVHISEPLPRLYGARQGIIEAVASDWKVSARAVRSIWEGLDDDL